MIQSIEGRHYRRNIEIYFRLCFVCISCALSFDDRFENPGTENLRDKMQIISNWYFVIQNKTNWLLSCTYRKRNENSLQLIKNQIDWIDSVDVDMKNGSWLTIQYYWYWWSMCAWTHYTHFISYDAALCVCAHLRSILVEKSKWNGEKNRSIMYITSVVE